MIDVIVTDVIVIVVIVIAVWMEFVMVIVIISVRDRVLSVWARVFDGSWRAGLGGQFWQNGVPSRTQHKILASGGGSSDLVATLARLVKSKVFGG